MPEADAATHRAPPSILGAVYAVLRTLTDRLDKLVGIATVAAFWAVLAMGTAEMLTRALLADSLVWVYEVSQLLANWIYFLGIVMIYHRGQDIFMSFFYDMLPQAARRPALLAIHVLTVGLFAVLIGYGIPLLELQSQSKTMGIGIARHWFSLPVVLGSAVMLLCVARQLLSILLHRTDDPGWTT